MDQKYVIAYDLGTSGVKVALVNLAGEVFGTASATYPLYVEQEGWAEQDPELYWEAVCKGTREVIAKCGVDPANAAGMAFGTQWKGIIPISAEGKVLHNSIIWLDARAADQAERLNRHFGREVFCASEYWPKLMWFRENCPECYEEAEIILEANSFLKWKATGVAAMDLTNCFVRSFDPEMQGLYDEILRFADISLDKFPKWVHPQDLVGHVTEQAAEELGLVPGVPVFGGCGDIPAIAIGSASARQGGSHIYLGTSGWVAYSVPHGDFDPEASPLDTKLDICMSGMNAVGLSLNWAVNRLYMAEWAELGGAVFDIVNQDVAQVSPGSEGLLCAPWFYGECPPLNEQVRGTYYGLGSQHDRRHMVRAVMEGICYTLKIGDELYRGKAGQPSPKEYYAIGGGSKSAQWMQMMADIFNVPILVPYSTQHTGAVGTAYCALIGLGICKDMDEAAQRVAAEYRYDPDPQRVAIYAEGLERFRRLYNALVPMYTNG